MEGYTDKKQEGDGNELEQAERGHVFITWSCSFSSLAMNAARQSVCHNTLHPNMACIVCLASRVYERTVKLHLARIRRPAHQFAVLTRLEGSYRKYKTGREQESRPDPETQTP